MKQRYGVLALMLVLSGCATNKAIVREQASMDMGCNPNEISVEFTDRPYVGVTRYSAEGCGMSRHYKCEKWNNLLNVVYTQSIPLGIPPACKRERS